MHFSRGHARGLRGRRPDHDGRQAICRSRRFRWQHSRVMTVVCTENDDIISVCALWAPMSHSAASWWRHIPDLSDSQPTSAAHLQTSPSDQACGDCWCGIVPAPAPSDCFRLDLSENCLFYFRALLCRDYLHKIGRWTQSAVSSGLAATAAPWAIEALSIRQQMIGPSCTAPEKAANQQILCFWSNHHLCSRGDDGTQEVRTTAASYYQNS